MFDILTAGARREIYTVYTVYGVCIYRFVYTIYRGGVGAYSETLVVSVSLRSLALSLLSLSLALSRRSLALTLALARSLTHTRTHTHTHTHARSLPLSLSPSRSHCPQFYKTWVNTPLKAQEQVETITRSHIGVPCCPVAGIPLPEERELLQQTQEFSLT